MLRRVRSRWQELEEALGWICPDPLAVCRESFPGRLLDGVATEEVVYQYVQGNIAATVGPIYPALGPTAFGSHKASLATQQKVSKAA